MSVAQTERMALQFELLFRHGFASYVDAGYCLDAPEAIPAGGCIPLSIAAWGVHHYAAQLVVGREDAPASEPIEDPEMKNYSVHYLNGYVRDVECADDDAAAAVGISDETIARIVRVLDASGGRLGVKAVWPTAERARATAVRLARLERATDDCLLHELGGHDGRSAQAAIDWLRDEVEKPDASPHLRTVFDLWHAASMTVVECTPAPDYDRSKLSDEEVDDILRAYPGVHRAGREARQRRDELTAENVLLRTGKTTGGAA